MRVGLSKKVLVVCFYLSILAGLYILRLHSFLLFHSVVELFSASVAVAIFMVVWNSRRFMQNDYLLFIGTAYLFIGGLDLIHTLAYQGMGVFQGYGTNLPTQLWISARYMESLSLLVAPFFLRRRLNLSILISVYALLFSILILLIFYWGVFPTCYNEQTGLTMFKEVSEYVIIGILLASLIRLLRAREKFDPRVLQYISWSIGLTMVSEFMFTMYVGPYETANMIGHLFKLVSFYLIYKALVVIGLKEPYNLLFRDLKQSEQELQAARDELEVRVQQRTAELAQSEERFRRMAETIPDVFWMRTPAAEKIVYVSPAYERIWGQSVESLYASPRSFFDAIDPEDESRVLAALKDHAKGFWNLEYRIRPPDGAVRWIRDRGFPIRDEQGNVCLMTGVATDITQVKLAERRVLDNQEQLRALTAELLMVEERERRIIAAELHDSVGQILAFLKIELGDLQRSGLSKDSISTVRHIREQIEQAIKQTRTLTFEMSPPELYTLGLGPAVEELAQRFTEARHLNCSVECCGQPKPLTDHAKILLYRSIRELLTNAAKHAQAEAVAVGVCWSDDNIRITVEDDGTGFDTTSLGSALHDKPMGFGLFSIRERLTHIGGSLDIQSKSGHGTKITLSVPVERRQSE